MACVQARYPRRLAYDRPRLRPCPTGEPDRLSPDSAAVPLPRQRGRPRLYPNTLFLKALLIIIVRSLHKVGGPLAVIEEPTQQMRSLRKLLREDGHFPLGRTVEGRLRVLPETGPAKLATAPYTWVTD